MDHVILTSEAALSRTLQQTLQGTLETLLPELIQIATAKPFLTKTDLMELTGWSSRQVEYKKSKREIPFIRRGRLVLFPTQEIFQYLREGYVPIRKVRDKGNDDG